VLFGLIVGNLIDLDHIYYRVIGKVGGFSSACPKLGMRCSFNFYPLHNLIMLVVAVALTGLLFFKNKKLKFVGWIALGVIIHLALYYLQLLIGIGI